MNRPHMLVEEAEDAELAARLARFRRNGEWLTTQGVTLLERHRGRYVAVSHGQVFAAADASEARRLARERHPDDEPFVQYIPQERALRIYAC